MVKREEELWRIDSGRESDRNQAAAQRALSHSLPPVTVPGAKRRRWLPKKRRQPRLYKWERMVMGAGRVCVSMLIPRFVQPSHIIQLTKCGYLHREWTVGNAQGLKQALCVMGTRNGCHPQGREIG